MENKTKAIQRLNKEIDKLILADKAETKHFASLCRLHKALTLDNLKIINKRHIFGTNFTIKSI